MPDQSSAATEHALLQEITAPLETLPDDPVAVVNADFPVGLRGYDRVAVDAYVQKVSQLVAELQATRTPEAAVRRALERVGEQITGILQRAHDTAEQITAQSRREAEDRLEASRVEAAQITAAAQQRVNDLDADTDRIWVERDRIIEDARELARQLSALAQTAADQSPSAAPVPYDDQPEPELEPELEPEPELELETEPGAAPSVETGRFADSEDTSIEASLDEDSAETVAFGRLGPPAGDEHEGQPVQPEGRSAQHRGEPGRHRGEPAEHAGQAAGEDQGQRTGEPPPRSGESPQSSDEPPQSSPAPIPAPGQHRRSSSVIPPASQAANRRFSR